MDQAVADRLDKESPPIRLIGDSGRVITIVTHWSVVSPGRLRLRQFINLKLVHYTDLEVDWTEGSQQYPVNVRPPGNIADFI